MGIKLHRVTVCTDEVQDIEATLRRHVEHHRVDYVLTSGGLGPTPDDRTMQGVAKAFDVPLEAAEEHRQWMRQRVRTGHELGYFESPEPNDGLWKMTYLPKGAEAMPNHIGTALGAIMTGGAAPTTVFTLPGPPKEFERMFHEYVAPRLEKDEPIHTQEMVLRGEESRFYGLLKEAEETFPDVQVGSYPEKGRIRFRTTGVKQRAEAAMEFLRSRTGGHVEDAS